MKPLYSQQDYDSARGTDKLPLECYFCKISFLMEKKLIKYAIKENISRGKYCSRKCSFKAVYLAVTRPCGQCGKLVTRELSQYKSSKSKKIFCNNSCAAKYSNVHKTKGTRRSKLEIWIEDQIKSLYPNLNIKFNDKRLIGSELDIYINNFKLAFELNGIFHYKPIYGLEKLASIQANDKSKLQACKEKNITLHTIDVSGQIRFTQEDSIKYLNTICEIINYYLINNKK